MAWRAVRFVRRSVATSFGDLGKQFRARLAGLVNPEERLQPLLRAEPFAPVLCGDHRNSAMTSATSLILSPLLGAEYFLIRSAHSAAHR